MRSSQAYHLTPMLDCVDRSLIADLARFAVLGRERARAQAPSPQPVRLTDLTGAVFTSSAAERGRARSGLSLRMRITKYASYCLALPLAATLVACGWRAPRATTRPPTPPPPSAATTTNPAPGLPSPPPPSPLDLPPEMGEHSFARGRITQRPYIVMIDNHPDAYPQSGLPQAAIVFEALAEGGVTRFMAVYAEGITPEVREIGPVRSVRLYFAQWAMSFQPIYLHVGGSPDALALVQRSQWLNTLDLDDLAHNRPYGWRDSRRSAPHNFYSNTKRLRAFTADHGFRSWSHPDPTIGYLFENRAPR